MSQNNLNESYDMQEFNYPVDNGAPPGLVRFGDSVATYGPDEENTSFEYDDGFHYRYRTTSLHRNVAISRQDGARNPSRSTNRRNVWINTAATLSRQPLEKHANEIVDKIEQDVYLMEDTQHAEQLRREALRDMPQSLTMKRLVKNKLLKNINHSTNAKRINIYNRTIYTSRILTSKFLGAGQNLLYTFELWYNSLKKIEGEFGSTVATYFKFYRWLFLLNIVTFIPIICFIIIPEMFDERRSHNNKLSFSDIFTGEGYFGDSLLFYGFYSNETISFSGHDYFMPHAYFFTMLSVYIFNFVIIGVSTAKSYKQNFIETKGSLKNAFVQKLFTSWDFSIATKNAAQLKSSSIYNELKELIDDSTSTKEETFFDKCITSIVQILSNVLITMTLSGMGYGMWMLLDENRKQVDKDKTNLGVINAIIINIIMCVVPLCFTYLIRYEGYKRLRTGFYITLARTFLLELVVIGVSIVYWLVHSKTEDCWETSIGQEIYRLVIFDFFFFVFFLVIVDVIRKLISKKMNIITAPEFEVARYALHLIYNQTLFWVGIYFSPLLGLIVTLKMVITWYITTLGTLNVCNPSSKSWRAAQAHTGLFVMSFMSLMLVVVVLGYIIARVPTSICGPFSGIMYVYNILKNGILQIQEGHIFWRILIYLTKPGAVALILLGMCVGIYYLRAKAKAQEKMVQLLYRMQVAEAKNREFLLQQISQVTEGKWQYNLHDHMAEPYKTSPSLYALIYRRLKEYEVIDEDDGTSEALLPSTSASTIPVEDVSYQSEYNQFKKFE